MISAPETLVHLFKPWSDFYSHSKVTETIVTFFHVGGLLLAGGFGVATDRATLRALRQPAARRGDQLAELAAVHRWVLTGLGVIVTSGVLQFTADLDTFLGSWIYWTKMGLVVALLANGYRMTRAEAALRTDASESAPAWATLRRTSITSMGLWFTITLFGVTLVNLA